MIMKNRLDEVRRLQKLAGISLITESYNQRRHVKGMVADLVLESLFREEEEEGKEGEDKKGEDKKSLTNLDDPKGLKASETAEKAIKSLDTSVKLPDGNDKEAVLNFILSSGIPKDLAEKIKANMTGGTEGGEKDQQQENFRRIREARLREAGIPTWAAELEKNKEKLKEFDPVSIGVTIAGLTPLALKAIGGAVNAVSRQFLKPEDKELYKSLKEKIEEYEKEFEPRIEEKIEKIKELKKDEKANAEELRVNREQLKHLRGRLKNKIQPVKKEIEDKFSTGFSKILDKIGHAIHATVIFPIRSILLPFYWAAMPFKKAWAATEPVANIIYAVGMIVYACWFGLGPAVAGGLSHLAGVGQIVHTILEGVEIGNSIKTIAVSALELAKVA